MEAKRARRAAYLQVPRPTTKVKAEGMDELEGMDESEAAELSWYRSVAWCQGLSNPELEGMDMMLGQDAREKSEKLDKAVKESRCWVEVTNAGIELYNFPQANRSKGVTLTSGVETEQRGKVSDSL